jgi:hypothetical protein
MDTTILSNVKATKQVNKHIFYDLDVISVHI